jgi:uncharacterized membrane protein YkvA (DUF1232 family)
MSISYLGINDLPSNNDKSYYAIVTTNSFERRLVYNYIGCHDINNERFWKSEQMGNIPCMPFKDCRRSRRTDEYDCAVHGKYYVDYENAVYFIFRGCTVVDICPWYSIKSVWNVEKFYTIESFPDSFHCAEKSVYGLAKLFTLFNNLNPYNVTSWLFDTVRGFMRSDDKGINNYTVPMKYNSHGECEITNNFLEYVENNKFPTLTRIYHSFADAINLHEYSVNEWVTKMDIQRRRRMEAITPTDAVEISKSLSKFNECVDKLNKEEDKTMRINILKDRFPKTYTLDNLKSVADIDYAIRIHNRFELNYIMYHYLFSNNDVHNMILNNDIYTYPDFVIIKHGFIDDVLVVLNPDTCDLGMEVFEFEHRNNCPCGITFKNVEKYIYFIRSCVGNIAEIPLDLYDNSFYNNHRSDFVLYVAPNSEGEIKTGSIQGYTLNYFKLINGSEMPIIADDEFMTLKRISVNVNMPIDSNEINLKKLHMEYQKLSYPEYDKWIADITEDVLNYCMNDVITTTDNYNYWKEISTMNVKIIDVIIESDMRTETKTVIDKSCNDVQHITTATPIKRTIIKWNDGTTTTVECPEKEYNAYYGFAIAVAKKAMGNDNTMSNEADKWVNKIPKQRAFEQAKKEREEAEKVEIAERKKAKAEERRRIRYETKLINDRKRAYDAQMQKETEQEKIKRLANEMYGVPLDFEPDESDETE